MEKVMKVVVCDACKKDRPAIAKIQIDVCGQHLAILGEKAQEVKPFACDACDRSFATGAGLRKHQTDTHGAKPATERTRARSKKRRTTRRAA